MGTDATTDAMLRHIIDAALRGELDEQDAARIYELGPEATTAFVMAISARITDQKARIAELSAAAGAPASGANTPSGAIPPYTKPATSKRRRGKPGARNGHEGSRRATPTADRIVRREQLEPLTICPQCDQPVERARRYRKRIIEDMPEETAVEAVEYKIPRHWCPCCRKHVEPKVKHALPGATIGHRLVALTNGSYVDADAQRLAKRLHRHQNELFTFLDRPEASWENNRAEREIRPAVILRKNSQCNRSERGAATQAVVMSIYRTLKLRGHDPRQSIVDALTSYAATGQLPPLPSTATANG